MEQEINIPYKSNYNLGIVFTLITLVAVAGNILSLFFPAVSCLSSLGSFLSFIIFMIWFYRSHKNLQAYNSMGLKYSPGWAVGSFFVPILNLFRPYQIAQEIWTASDPQASTVGWKQSKLSIVVIFWWLSVILYYVIIFSTMGFSVWIGIQSAMNGVEPDIAQITTVGIPILIGYVLYSILSITLVNLVNDRQEEKAEILELF
jgi:hypothetical protein